MPADSPYHVIQGGTAESVKKLTAKDLRAYHAKYFVPNNMIVAVFGDIDPGRGIGLGEEALRRAARPIPISSRSRSSSRTPSRRRSFATRRSARPTGMVMFGYPTASIFEKEDYSAMTVLGAIMAGYQYPGGWLHNELARRGAGVRRSCLSDDRPRAGLFRDPRANPARQGGARSSRGSRETCNGRRRAGSARTNSASPSKRVIALHAQESTAIGEQAAAGGPRRADRARLRLSQDV